MLRLKIILQSNMFYFILFLIISIYTFYFTKVVKYESIFSKDTSVLEVKVKEYKIDGDKLSLFLKNKETIKGTYYLKSQEEKEWFEKNLSIGKTLKIYGEEKELLNNTIPNTFNYKKYLYYNHIYFNFNISKIEILDRKVDLLSKITELINKKIVNNGDNPYLKAFILGDKASIDKDMYDKIKTNGVSHLFALSGMHLSLLYLILNKLLNKIKNKKKIIYLFLIFYLSITGFSISFTRAILFMFLLDLRKLIKLELNSLKVLFLTAFIILLIKPFSIYNIGFWYTFIVTFSLLLVSPNLKNKNKFISTIYLSIITFLFSLPISIYINYEINLLSIINNIILVPFISSIIFPLAILTFIFSFLTPLFNCFIFILEGINNLLAYISIPIIFGKISIIEIIIYYLILITILTINQKKLFVFLIIYLSFWYYKDILKTTYDIYFLDVNQGDCALLTSPQNKEIILIDTGGKINYKKDTWQEKDEFSLSINIIIFLKSLRIRNIDLLIISHGDFDHLGYAYEIGEEIPYKNVLLNEGDINLEENKLISKYKEIKEYKSKEFNLEFLETNLYQNENDNSRIVKLKIKDKSFLFMGDASKKVEEDLIKKYNLEDIDVLKVAHHGSKTSSSKNFIDNINPKYTIISVGKNNKYGHPNGEVLNTLKDSKIYRTDLDGSIEIKLNKNGYQIRTCSQ